MQTIFGLAQQYWGICVAFVIAAVYVIIHRKQALEFAKKTAATLIIAAEKGAEDLSLKTGKDKFAWVIEKGYDFLPAAVRLVINKPLFEILVQSVFDEAVNFAEKHRISIPADSTNIPVTNTPA